MRKFAALFLSLCLLLSLSPVFAERADDWSKEEYAAHADIRTETAADYTGKTVILHSNDVHGQIDGYAWIAGLKNWFEGLGANVLLVDAGDFSQGSVYVNSTKGMAAVELMNEAGYDLATLGNHEFDFGYAKLLENLSQAKFASLCGNITLDATGATIFPAATIVEVDESLKLGFFGLDTPETVTKANPRLINMITFSTFDQLYEDAQKAVDALDGADLKIGLVHLGMSQESKPNGYRSLDLLQKTRGIDFLIDGHSHYVMTSGQNGEPIQSTGTRFEYVGVIVIDNESKTIEDHFLMPTCLGNSLYAMTAVDENVLGAAKAIITAVDRKYGEKFATTEVTLNGERNPGNRTEETNLGDLITDAIIWFVVHEGGFEQTEPNHVVGVLNGGSIRVSISEGDITRRDIKSVMPFGNTVAVVYVTGSDLLEALEASTFCSPDAIGGYPQTSGISWTLDTTRPYDRGAVYVLDGKESSYYAPASINRVTITAINGEPFDEDGVYAVVTSNFCASGGDTYNVFGRSISSFDTGIPQDEVVIAYIEEALGGRITKEAYGAPQGRVTLIR